MINRFFFILDMIKYIVGVEEIWNKRQEVNLEYK